MLLLLEDRRHALGTLGITYRTKRHKHHSCKLSVGTNEPRNVG